MKVFAVCIDDFALKKRQRYGTIMVDLETHEIVDMIESRERCDVSRWLSGFPNLRVVSRDGSQTYASAITESHPSAMQISDRFHIIKNLNERAAQVFQKMFQGRIAIPITSGTQNIRYEALVSTRPGRIKLVKRLRADGSSYNEIAQLTGLSLEMVKNYATMRECDIPDEKHTVRGREHGEAVMKLLKKAQRCRSLHESGLGITEISRRTGFTYERVRTYLTADFSPVNAHYGKQREGKLAPFRDDIVTWRTEGLKYQEIHERIKVKGYSGTQDAIRGFMSKESWIRRDFQTAFGGEPVEYIDKKWIIRLLYKSATEVKGITQEQLGMIFISFPLAEKILDIVHEFRAIFKKKNPDSLSPWMDKVYELGIPELDTFINGLKQDIDAVMNAITSEFSNGLAEGTINKIKVIKRIMYGRCRFDLLKSKCILLNHW